MTKESPGFSRRRIRLDSLILATAEVHKAAILYTEEDKMGKVAKRKKLNVEVRYPPEPEPVQAHLSEVEKEST